MTESFGSSGPRSEIDRRKSIAKQSQKIKYSLEFGPGGGGGHPGRRVPFKGKLNSLQILSEAKICNSGVAMSDDDTNVFSPYFSKVDDGHCRTMNNETELIKKKNKRKTKKTSENDRACNELEREVLCVIPSIVSSPYFLADGANDHEKSKSESMEKGEDKKVKKRRKVIEKRTSLEIDNEAEAEECHRKVTSASNTVGVQDIKVKDESARDRENNCEIYTEQHEATSSCSKNVRRKRVKLRKLDKSHDDQIPPGDNGGSTIKISKKKRMHLQTVS